MLMAFMAVFLFSVVGGDALAQIINPGRDMTQAASELGGGETSFRQIVLTIVNFVLGFLAILAVVMIIYGGFLYVSSAGNQEKADQGKQILTYAVIGIVIILISFALVQTVLTAAMPGSGGTS